MKGSHSRIPLVVLTVGFVIVLSYLSWESMNTSSRRFQEDQNLSNQEDDVSDDEEKVTVSVYPDDMNEAVVQLHSIIKSNTAVDILRLIDLIREFPGCELAEGPDGLSAMHLCVQIPNQDPSIVLMISKLSPESLIVKSGKTKSQPLHLACDRNDPSYEIISIILKAYPDSAKEFDDAGFLPFHYAVNRRKPKLDILKLLLDVYPEAIKQSTRDSGQETALHLHVRQMESDPNVVRFLMATYPDISHIKDAVGLTAYELFLVEDDAKLSHSKNIRTPPIVYPSTLQSSSRSSRTPPPSTKYAAKYQQPRSV